MNLKFISNTLILLLLTMLQASAQTIYSANFSVPSGFTFNVPTGPNGADPNFWLVSAAEGGVLPTGCGVNNNGNPTLHITSVFCPTCGAHYDAGGLCGLLFCPQTNSRAESPTIVCTGFTNLFLNFHYMEGGDALNDNFTLDYFDGAIWTPLTDPAKTPVCGGGQGQWTNFNIALPASANGNPNVKIGFNWTNNDDGIGADPSVAIDNIIVYSNIATPLTLVKFEGKNEKEIINLNWTSNHETNVKQYDIEKQNTDQQFVKIGTVIAKNTFLNEYTFADQAPMSGSNIYRLKMTDADETFTYSKVINVQGSMGANSFFLYPNPSKDILHVSRNFEGSCHIVLSDQTGKIHVDQNNSITDFKLDIRGLAKGIYFVRCNSNTLSKTFRFVKE